MRPELATASQTTFPVRAPAAPEIPQDLGIQWDAENRLVAVLQGSTTLASFAYDGEGKRTQKTTGGVTHTYVYDAGNMVEERVSSGQTLDYVQGLRVDRPLAQRDQASVVSYFLADHLGSIAQVTNSGGAATVTREYDPWGEPTPGERDGGLRLHGKGVGRRDWALLLQSKVLRSQDRKIHL